LCSLVGYFLRSIVEGFNVKLLVESTLRAAFCVIRTLIAKNSVRLDYSHVSTFLALFSSLNWFVLAKL